MAVELSRFPDSFEDALSTWDGTAVRLLLSTGTSSTGELAMSHDGKTAWLLGFIRDRADGTVQVTDRDSERAYRTSAIIGLEFLGTL